MQKQRKENKSRENAERKIVVTF